MIGTEGLGSEVTRGGVPGCSVGYPLGSLFAEFKKGVVVRWLECGEWTCCYGQFPISSTLLGGRNQ